MTKKLYLYYHVGWEKIVFRIDDSDLLYNFEYLFDTQGICKNNLLNGRTAKLSDTYIELFELEVHCAYIEYQELRLTIKNVKPKIPYDYNREFNKKIEEILSKHDKKDKSIYVLSNDSTMPFDILLFFFYLFSTFIILDICRDKYEDISEEKREYFDELKKSYEELMMQELADEIRKFNRDNNNDLSLLR